MQSTSDAEPMQINPPEPRWLVVVAMLAAGGFYYALPEPLSLGPRWLLLAIVSVLLVPAVLTNHRRLPTLNVVIGHTLSGVITVFMIASLFLLIRGLFAHAESPAAVLLSGVLIWVTNMLAFASWYWRLDAGGPHGRASRLGHSEGAFLFPQMTMDKEDAKESNGTPWYPRFADYLFLAFNTSTAFSPTDTPVLSRWAKVLSMIQSLISLTITLLLVGRAVNIM
jgi:hypothetical protein